MQKQLEQDANLLRVVLEKYHQICNIMDWDYEFHYIEDIKNNANGLSEALDTIKKGREILKGGMRYAAFER